MGGMLLKTLEVHPGWHPSERMVLIAQEGERTSETVFVSDRSLADDKLEVSWPLDQRPGQVLVELPRETMSGAWRVWVRPQDLSERPVADH